MCKDRANFVQYVYRFVRYVCGFLAISMQISCDIRAVFEHSRKGVSEYLKVKRETQEEKEKKKRRQGLRFFLD